uniref:Uncharacterized protein n=1 Tax=Anguilla anguilla TaxID=7936 RepID=A0A0E9V5T9_ANGAN
MWGCFGASGDKRRPPSVAGHHPTHSPEGPTHGPKHLTRIS